MPDDSADRASSCPNGYPVFVCVFTEVPNDEEITRKALGFDHVEFSINPGLYLIGDFAISLFRSFVADSS